MSVQVALTPIPILQFFNNLGQPNIGGSLLTQVGGVNYATYSDSAGSIPLPNPIPLNSRGEVSTAAGASTTLYLQTGVAYTFTLSDKNGNQLWSVSNIFAPTTSFPTSSGTANAQIITNNIPITIQSGTLQWFFPVAANTGATTVNVDNNGAKNIFYLTHALVGGELQPSVPMLIIYDGTQWNLAWSAKGPATDYYADTGTVNVLAITANMAQTAYADGMRFKVKVANTTTASTPTLNVNGIGAKNIYYPDTVTGLIAGANIATGIYTYTYDSSLNSAAGGFICSDCSRVTGSFTLTLTGMASTTTGTINYAIGPDGKTVYIWCTAGAGITGTSNAATMTGTGVPAILSSVTNHSLHLAVTDSTGGVQLGNMIGTNGTTWTFGKGFASSGGFTTSGTKGLNDNATWGPYIYTLD